MIKNLLLAIVAIAMLIVGVMAFNQWQQKPLPEYALYYQQPRIIKPFTLLDQYGKPFTKQNLQGKWSWIFLGYTSCPDVCPTTLQELNFIYDDLKKITANTQILFVTADPKRDSIEKLKQYTAYFNKAFIALRGEHDVLFPFTRNIGLMYGIVDDSASDDGYLVSHSASMVLVNPQGNIAAIFKPDTALGKIPSIDGEKLLADFAKIVALN